MDDLIKRADAMGAVQDHFNANGFKGYDDGQKMMDRIKALPSAELPKGELISRADAICEVLVNDGIENIVNRINALPSTDAVSREKYDTVCAEYNRLVHDAICRNMCDEKCKYEKGKTCYHAREHSAIEELSADAVSRDVYDKRTQADEEIIDSYRQEFQKALSAEAVDCTDFIEWLVDRVLDETIWENNSVAYGEIICRKLVKLGVLEVTEEPSYYIRPSAEAVTIHEDGTLAVKVPNAHKVGRVLVMDTDSHIGGGLFYPDDAVHGEWIEREDWNGDYYYDCSVCGESFVLCDGTPSMNLYHFCPNCGARMKGGAE